MNYTKILLIGLFLWAGVYCSHAQNNITITDNASHNADASAMLDVYSITKGMLVPRMTTTQMVTISNPATGLLIFNTSINSFWFFNGSIWIDLSGDTESLWGVNSTTGDVYLTDLQTNIGIGTDTPLSKLALVANTGADPDEPLFEILDEFGKPIFSVTSEGVRIYIKDVDTKGVSGGFAVGRYGIAKGIPDTTFLLVTPDSTRVYIQEESKGVSGGFAVGRYGIAKGADNFLHLTEKNSFIGHNNGHQTTTAYNNIFIGNNTGALNSTGSYNILIGTNCGNNFTSGSNNLFIGYSAGRFASNVTRNIFIGEAAGHQSSGDDNVFIGYNAGFDETNSNQFIVRNLNSGADPQADPLIRGDFLEHKLRLNAETGIGGPPDPPYMLTVYGNAFSHGEWLGSDKKWKKNINILNYGLDVVNKLNPVTYNWRVNEYQDMNFTEDRQIGFIAQELELIIPELVKTDTKGNKAISYSKFTPILVKAIQEQQKQIEELNKKIDELLKLIENK